MATTKKINTESEMKEELKQQDRVEVFVAPSGENTSPIPVCINGCITLVPVGQRVMVARSIAERLQHIDAMTRSARTLMAEYETGKKRL